MITTLLNLKSISCTRIGDEDFIANPLENSSNGSVLEISYMKCIQKTQYLLNCIYKAIFAELQ